MKNNFLRACVIMAIAAPAAQAAPVELIAIGSLSGSADLSSSTGYTLESGVAGNVLGGMGSGLAWAGGDTLLALPDRGPNATAYTNGAAVDNTTSYVPRFQTVSLTLSATPAGSLPYTLTPSLTNTTLLYSPTALNYGSTAGLPSGVPSINAPGQYYFTGRSDAFAAGLSTNPSNGRLDPESIRMSADGKSVFVSDEYGPYIYQFDRATGERMTTFTLPDHFAIANQNAVGANEISGNTSGRVTNKGMEGLAISPDGKTLIGFMQSPLIQDGGDGGRMNRIVTIDIATGAVHEYAYDNHLDTTNKNYNSSEILAINSHQFLVLERDGKGLGDGSNAVIKKVFKIDIDGATDVSGISGEAALRAQAVNKTEFLDIKAALNAAGISDANIPAKLEGMAFGADIERNGALWHTLYVANDNDFVPGLAGPNNFYVFAVDGTALPDFETQDIAPVPVPAAGWLLGSGLLGMLGYARKRRGLAC